MYKYDIRDVWASLKTAGENFIITSLVIWLVGPILFGFVVGILQGSNVITGVTSKFILENEHYQTVGLVLTAVVFVQSIIIYLANRKYVIDIEEGVFTFPRSDMENSIIAIILLFPYWNLMRTKTIHCYEIENIYLDTKRWTTKNRAHTGYTSTGKAKYQTKSKNHVRYTINITGTFGSANLSFLSRQKRDEVRNAIQQCVRQDTGKNIDKKVAEFN